MKLIIILIILLFLFIYFSESKKKKILQYNWNLTDAKVHDNWLFFDKTDKRSDNINNPEFLELDSDILVFSDDFTIQEIKNFLI